MKTNITGKGIKELDALSVRYARFFDKFRDIGLERDTEGRVFLRLRPKTDARGVNRLYPVFPPGFELTEVF